MDSQTNTTANDAVIDKGVEWLLRNYGARCGWVANPSRFPQNPDCYLGLTSQTLYILSLLEDDFTSLRGNPDYAKAERQYLGYVTPINDFHEASKTTDDDGYVRWIEGDQEKLIPIQAWSFFAYPWTLAELHHLSSAPNLDPWSRLRAKLKFDRLVSRFPKAEAISDSCCTFELAENLYAAHVALAPDQASK